MKILISAYACEPGFGSEPGIGWNIARRLADHHEVWVLTWSAHRRGIEPELERNPVPGLHVVYIGLPKDSLWWRGFGVQVHYYFWQIKVYFIARYLHDEFKFDLAQHVTYTRYWFPSLISLLPLPFIFGPVGGAESSPKSFRSCFNAKGRLLEWVREIARWVGEHDPFTVSNVRGSVISYGTTRETCDRLRALGSPRVEMLPSIGLSGDELHELGSISNTCPTVVRFVSSGRLLNWKGFALGLSAFARAQIDGAEYWIVGEGPDEHRLKSLADRLGISRRVVFKGGMKRDAFLELLTDCHVLVHPSLHDSGGFVCIEAMAAGRPVICLDLGGPAVLVTNTSGIKVPACSISQATEDLADAMRRLAASPELRAEMGRAGQNRVRSDFNWETRVKCLPKAYQGVVDGSLTTALSEP